MQRMVEPWAQGQTDCLYDVGHHLPVPKVGAAEAYTRKRPVRFQERTPQSTQNGPGP